MHGLTFDPGQCRVLLLVIFKVVSSMAQEQLYQIGQLVNLKFDSSDESPLILQDFQKVFFRRRNKFNKTVYPVINLRNK